MKCKKCGEDKKTIEFSNDSYSPTGKKSYCKACMKAYQSNHYRQEERKVQLPKSLFKKDERPVVGWNGDDEIYF